MNFELTADAIAFQDAAHRVSAEVLKANAKRYDETGDFCRESLDALGELGFWGMNLPEAYGGFDPGSIAMSLAVEEVAYHCAATCSSLTAHFLATDSVLLGGTEQQKQELLPLCASGQKLGAFALTEPGAGSNPAEMRTKAVRREGGWHLTGTKHYITNGAYADFLVVYAKTDESQGHKGISAFLVDRHTPGIQFSSPEKTLGLRGSHIYEISFDCQLSEASLLGDEGQGFATAMAVLDRGRVEVAAMSVGIARAAYDDSLAWAQERVVAGKPLCRHQGIQWMLAEMHTQLEAAKLVTYQAAAARDSGGRFSLESAVAKLFASEAAAKITDSAVQVHGGYGYICDLPIERYYRDARITRIFEGTSEIQKIIIGRAITA
ncbi:acyl-CoA dehydrogenase family protein [Bisbaumannia pacifica]|uniref:3-sulfinopropanoyl-CoA desulfinase n=1 Tax=Bisbaumannia pacifica TaxID=77098 RepID=A0A510XCX4_9GAMM|nr:acyl-CoA dehydrogenase family protein [Halomonas pacifica]MBH8581998.1 acyl-CoA dehydrogenase family protein [Halomonas pacifica]GEK49268.1 acyl-CoA dehydrogenase [Halomonas pacifica]